MRITQRSTGATRLVLACALAAGSSWSGAAEEAAAVEGAGAPAAVDFQLEALGGGKVRLSEHRGKVVLLFFASDDCGVCHEELPALDAIASRYRDAGLQVLGILAREPARASALREAAFPMLVADDAVRDAYRVPGYPLHYLIGKDFTVQAKHRGWSDGRQQILDAEVRQLLGGEVLNEQGQDLYRAQGSWEGHWSERTGRRLRTDELMPMLSSADVARREWVVDELGRRGARDAVAMLATIATAPREPLALRRKALAALRSIGSDDAAGTYLKLARSTGEPALLRSEAVDGLRTVLDHPGVRAALPGLVRDAEPNVRLAAATLAGEACVTEAAEALAAAESGEPNAWVASAIAAARSELASCGGR